MNNNRFIREQERRSITGISRTHTWRLEQQGQFPKRIKLGTRCVGWKLNELQDWIEKQTAIEEK
ncbi:helix-turn-helix transcriptional regulator [Photobacterium kishitanii]|uniref:helix-turn-helix transcriptional regulator n=1 Tax=Photobacterium kishitanii TaxID=318456 RepID=UPI001F47E397|nr:AlpA family phage regulatory protein [Photobacterium kishitanii]